ncbi:uncharacterized protein APUU_31594A [Aspergillus puulaauensis]|uniref:Uncharacterized protein n=1 Tax=Aspergillus puulaauensis TaxID=1220207 RepID=A0A7R7XLQ8_9EURO|nr:uncharacterized protein APUU_31594A [Aspergillus puulaauensis]BCS23368.1 hypothetical protein APUU_31594A [Aspergillus puulaauensis]
MDLSFLSCWCGATFFVRAFLVIPVERGPALPARVEAGVPALGVPGPSEDWRRLEEAAGRVPREALRRRRLFSTAPAEDSRWRCWNWAAAEAGVAGAELRAAFGEDIADVECDLFNERLSLCVAPSGFALPVDAVRGEEYDADSLVESGKKIFGGSRYESLLLKSEGIGGSLESTPSFCKSRIFTSSLFICLSSRIHAFSLRWIFSSCSCCDLSRFCSTAFEYCSSFGFGVRLPLSLMNFCILASRELMIERQSWIVLSLACISSIKWLISAGRFATSCTNCSSTEAQSSWPWAIFRSFSWAKSKTIYLLPGY